MSQKKHSGKSQKYLPLSNADIVEERILLPGRRPCNCEASRHGLVNNCLECGRIVCEQEGSGMCFTCGAVVCTNKEKEIIMKQSKASFKLLNKLMNQDNDVENPKLPSTSENKKLQIAIEHRNMLLEYDRTIEKRTKVIDDENDYFQIDSQWLSSREKKILSKKQDEIYDEMHTRQKQKLTFDFAGRQIREEKPDMKIDIDELLQSDNSIFKHSDFTELGMPLDIQPVYEDANDMTYCTPRVKEDEKRLNIRIQDKELQEMSDEGQCLSLHQPYASLLAAGIKIHEGRVWYTSYRGRLWIHAAGKNPTKQEISEMENHYRHMHGNCKFPKSYPTGCLLGCVDLIDCLPQEEYRCQFPEGDSSSPYVFICENAQELVVKFPIQGKHKLFKLDSNILQAAKKTLRK